MQGISHRWLRCTTIPLVTPITNYLTYSLLVQDRVVVRAQGVVSVLLLPMRSLSLTACISPGREQRCASPSSCPTPVIADSDRISCCRHFGPMRGHRRMSPLGRADRYCRQLRQTELKLKRTGDFCCVAWAWCSTVILAASSSSRYIGYCF